MSQKNQSIYNKQKKTALVGLLADFPGFIVMTVSAVMTGSLLVWLDFLDSLCYEIQTAFVTLISKKLSKNLKFEYNYGIKRIEILSSLFCDMLLCFGTLAIGVVAVYEIFNPVRPSDLLFIPIIVKIIDVLVDVWLFVSQLKIRKLKDTPIVRTEYFGTVKDLCFDVTSMLLLFVCYFLRDYTFSWYFAPAACIVITVYFIVSRIKDIRRNLESITDKTLDEDSQLKILKVLAKYDGRYDRLVSVKSHQLSGTAVIDFHLSFKPDTSYCEIQELKSILTEELHKVFDECEINIAVE